MKTKPTITASKIVFATIETALTIVVLVFSTALTIKLIKDAEEIYDWVYIFVFIFTVGICIFMFVEFIIDELKND